jgi:hypothetical protein
MYMLHAVNKEPYKNSWFGVATPSTHCVTLEPNVGFTAEATGVWNRCPPWNMSEVVPDVCSLLPENNTCSADEEEMVLNATSTDIGHFATIKTEGRTVEKGL